MTLFLLGFITGQLGGILAGLALYDGSRFGFLAVAYWVALGFVGLAYDEAHELSQKEK